MRWRRSFDFNHLFVANELGYETAILNLGPDLLKILILNATTAPERLAFNPNLNCIAPNASCPIIPPGEQPLPQYSGPVNITQRSFYTNAILDGSTWGSPILSTFIAELKTTFSFSVEISGLQYVFGADVLLTSLSSILLSLASSLQGPTTSSQPEGTSVPTDAPAPVNDALSQNLIKFYLSFIVDSQGYMVATSTANLDEIQNLTVACNSQPSCVRVFANSTSNSVVRQITAELLKGLPGRWNQLPLNSAREYNAVVKSPEANYVVWVRQIDATNVPWYVVSTFDATQCLRMYQTVDSIVTPIVIFGLILFALALSFHFTGSLATTLQHVSRQLGTIASLDLNPVVDPSLQSSHLREVVRINETMELMRRSLNSFSKYVPRDVVRLLQLLKREAVLGVDEVVLSVKNK